MQYKGHVSQVCTWFIKVEFTMSLLVASVDILNRKKKIFNIFLL